MAEQADAAVLTGPRTFEFRRFELPEIGPDEGVLRVEAAGLCGTDYEQYTGHLVGTPWERHPDHPRPRDPGLDRPGRTGSRQALEGQGRRSRGGRGDHRVRPLFPVRDRQDHAVREQSGLRGSTSRPTRRPACGAGMPATCISTRTRWCTRSLKRFRATCCLCSNPLANGVRWAYEAPNTQIGETVVIEGPGQRGLLCALAAREAGAGTVIVTGTAQDAHRLALARALGADATIDVDAQNPVEVVRELTGGRRCRRGGRGFRRRDPADHRCRGDGASRRPCRAGRPEELSAGGAR